MDRIALQSSDSQTITQVPKPAMQHHENHKTCKPHPFALALMLLMLCTMVPTPCASMMSAATAQSTKKKAKAIKKDSKCDGDKSVTKSFRLHPVDSTAYSIKVALDSIVIPGSRKRNLLVTRKIAPGVPPEFHYEPDTTYFVYVYHRNDDEIVFESRPGSLLRQRDNPFAVLRMQYGKIVFDKSLKDWVSVSPNTVSVEMSIGDCEVNDGSICIIKHGYPLPDDFWTRRFTIKRWYDFSK